jgi:hypothetical protein
MRSSFNRFFKSTAKVVHLGHFKKGHLMWGTGKCSEDHEYSFYNSDEGYFPKLPVILQSSGVPWDIGNAYLLGQLEKPSLSSMRTLTDRANHLKYYLQYLEDTGQHFLDLPKAYYDRAPQRFKVFMAKILDRQEVSVDYINNILSTVAHFYTNIQYESLVTEESLKSQPFTQIKKTIMVPNGVGLIRNLQVVTSDLRIKSSRNTNSQVGLLTDGGRLRPLIPEEQAALWGGVRDGYASIELELMMRIALETGARQQTVCTLSILCIRKAYENLKAGQSSVVIKAGQRRNADTKGGKLNKLIFTRQLVVDLITYVDCERAEKRRLHDNSFYRNTDDNYVFLTRDGNPYYTAQRELSDRQDPLASLSIKAPVIVPRDGKSLRNELSRFISRINKNNSSTVSFTFHDLRATMGMNLVRSMRAQGYPDSKIFDHVRQRLNHTDFKTTEGYLNFDSELSDFNNIQEEFGAMISMTYNARTNQ